MTSQPGGYAPTKTGRKHRTFALTGFVLTGSGAVSWRSRWGTIRRYRTGPSCLFSYVDTFLRPIKIGPTVDAAPCSRYAYAVEREQRLCRAAPERARRISSYCFLTILLGHPAISASCRDPAGVCSSRAPRVMIHSQREKAAIQSVRRYRSAWRKCGDRRDPIPAAHRGRYASQELHCLQQSPKVEIVKLCRGNVRSSTYKVTPRALASFQMVTCLSQLLVRTSLLV